MISERTLVDRGIVAIQQEEIPGDLLDEFLIVH